MEAAAPVDREHAIKDVAAGIAWVAVLISAFVLLIGNPVTEFRLAGGSNTARVHDVECSPDEWDDDMGRGGPTLSCNYRYTVAGREYVGGDSAIEEGDEVIYSLKDPSVHRRVGSLPVGYASLVLYAGGFLAVVVGFGYVGFGLVYRGLKYLRINKDPQLAFKSYLSVSVGLRIIGAVLLFVALATQPYQYFTILRLTTVVISAYMIFVVASLKRWPWLFPFAFTLLLFLPRLWPLKRETWEIVDVITGAFFVLSILLVRESQAAVRNSVEICQKND